MEDLMRADDVLILDDNDSVDEDAAISLEDALRSIEDDDKFSIPMSQLADKKMKGISKFEFTQRLCIKSYLNLRVRNNYGKMDASIATAATIFCKSPTKDSYRARAVREWAAYFLSHGELRPFRRGKFVKTYTIIVNEAVQVCLRDKIRSLRHLSERQTMS